MNRSEFEQVQDTQADEVMVSMAQVRGKDRTLVYGYTVDRDTFHAYVYKGELHILVYDHKGNVFSHDKGTELPAASFAYIKRAYPERCDAIFALMMRSMGFPIPFTAFDQDAYDKHIFHTFYGKVEE